MGLRNTDEKRTKKTMHIVKNSRRRQPCATVAAQKNMSADLAQPYRQPWGGLFGTHEKQNRLPNRVQAPLPWLCLQTVQLSAPDVCKSRVCKPSVFAIFSALTSVLPASRQVCLPRLLTAYSYLSQHYHGQYLSRLSLLWAPSKRCSVKFLITFGVGWIAWILHSRPQKLNRARIDASLIYKRN